MRDMVWLRRPPPACERTWIDVNLFLDTNIYLGFYKLSEDDLEELKKLSVTVRSKATVLYLTDQVRHEFRRNREKAISDSLAILESAKLPKSFPRLFTNLSGYTDLRTTIRQFEEQLASLLADARQAASDGSLHADALIEELFALAKPLEMHAEVWSAARMRRDLGNPPGKDDSYGDAVNWESLLADVPNGEDLVLVTADLDYMSKLDRVVLDEFLRTEWETKKCSQITAHASLTALFKKHYPDIRLAAELEKELAIDKLIISSNFRSTHSAIRDLSHFSDFSPAQVGALVEAANHNSQVEQILEDDDVRAFFDNLTRTYSEVIDAKELSQLGARLAESGETD